MRWITFFILLLVMGALQSAHFGGIPYQTAPDWSQYVYWPKMEYVLALAIFYALYAAEGSAPLCGLVCGILYDLMSDQFVGLNAVPLALVCLGIVRMRLSLFREHGVSQALVTLLALVAFGMMACLFQWALGSPLAGHSVMSQIGTTAGNAGYTAVVAPFMYWVFFRFPNLLGFTSHGSRSRAQY